MRLPECIGEIDRAEFYHFNLREWWSCRFHGIDLKDLDVYNLPTLDQGSSTRELSTYGLVHCGRLISKSASTSRTEISVLPAE